MMALRAHTRGGPEQLVYEQAPVPSLSPERAKAAGVHAMFFVVTPDPGELAQLSAMVDDGRLRAIVSQTFPLRAGRAAFESAAQPRPPGKTVLLP